MTDDLVTRAKTLSAMINLGERISWGQDTAMIDELAARIEADAATIARLEGERDAIERLYMSECEAYCEAHEAMLAADDARIAAEAKLAQAVEVLQYIAFITPKHPAGEGARAFLDSMGARDA